MAPRTAATLLISAETCEASAETCEVSAEACATVPFAGATSARPIHVSIDKTILAESFAAAVEDVERFLCPRLVLKILNASLVLHPPPKDKGEL